MGLPLQINAPQITVGGRTFGVGAFLWNAPDGSNYTLGVYELKATGWDFVASPNNVALYLNPGEMVADIKAKGGAVKYLQWLILEINKAFAKLFGAAVPIAPVPTEPTTDDEALAWVAAQLKGMTLRLVNGVPVLA